MCKLFIATGTISKQQTLKLIEKAASLFSRTQKDGFGFVAYGSNGTVATGHYLEPANFPGFNVSLPEWIECNRIESGRIPENVTALVCHGRTATSKVVIANVHPFNNKHLFLSHNGVLSWIGSGPEPKAKHACDSEQFLNWFSTLKAPFNETKANWSGYGVFGIINTRAKTLTVAKCGNGKLSYSATDTCHLWSTDSADVEALGKVLANNATRPLAMRAKTVCRFDISKRKPRLLSVDNWEGFGSVSHKSDDWFRSMGQTSRRTVWPVSGSTNDSFPDWEPATATATTTTTGAL
jgi:predicted glutamine amidotransferase